MLSKLSFYGAPLLCHVFKYKYIFLTLNMNKLPKLLTVCFSFYIAQAVAPSIAQDAVYINKVGGGTTRVTGKISRVTPEAVTIDDREIAASEIRRISVGKEPAAINRLREEMFGGQYAECLAGIEKLNAIPDVPLLKQEVDFMKAYSSARLSLTQGVITPEAAGKAVREFLASAPNSLHAYSAIEQYGRLIYSIGKPELAAKEFEKLRDVKWEQYRMRGRFLHGRMMSVLGQTEKAKADFEKILQQSSTSAESDNYKLLARCEQARLSGITGNSAAALKELNKLIKNESDENAELFAHIYNAIGAIHEKSRNLKAARDAYLHTHLLFGSVEDPAAEALSRLSEIFVSLEDSKRANEARRELRSKYRNSYWGRKIGS